MAAAAPGVMGSFFYSPSHFSCILWVWEVNGERFDYFSTQIIISEPWPLTLTLLVIIWYIIYLVYGYCLSPLENRDFIYNLST